MMKEMIRGLTDSSVSGRTETPIPAGPMPLIGQQVGNVRVTGLLGEGGFGSVYHAEHIFLGTSYALKVLHLDTQANSKQVARFQREARALSHLRHPNVVLFYDFGQLADAGFYMLMEFLRGQNLFERLCFLAERRSMYNIEALGSLVSPLCDAFSYIHKKGLVHRDLKPSNIFFHQNEDGEEEVRLVDFGIVSIMGEGGQLTEAGVSIGTSSYLSPEQGRGEHALDGRSDLYSLGVLLFRLLTNRLPFKGSSAFDTILLHLQEPIPCLADKAPWKQWSPQLEAFVQRALAKEPDERPQSAAMFKQECLAALEAQIAFEKRTQVLEEACTVREGSSGAQRMIANIEQAKQRFIEQGTEKKVGIEELLLPLEEYEPTSNPGKDVLVLDEESCLSKAHDVGESRGTESEDVDEEVLCVQEEGPLTEQFSSSALVPWLWPSGVLLCVVVACLWWCVR